MIRVLLAAILLSVYVNAPAFADVNVGVRRLGYLGYLLKSYRASRIQNELKLSEKQIERINEFALDFVESNSEVLKSLSTGADSAQDYGAYVEANKGKVDKLNSQIKGEFRKIFGIRRYKRYSELVTQDYLRSRRFAEVASLHGITCSLNDLSDAVSEAEELKKGQQTRIAASSWQAASKPLGDVIAPAVVKAAAGKIFEGDLPKGGRVRRNQITKFDIPPFLSDEIDTLPLVCIRNASVQIELAMTVEQVRLMSTETSGLSGDIKKAVTAMNELLEELRKQSLQPTEKDVSEFRKQLQELSARTSQVVNDVLDQGQRDRLSQIMFQHYVAEFEYKKALALVGKTTDSLKDVPVDRQRAKVTQEYLRLADELAIGFRAFDTTIGKGRTSGWIGRSVLPYVVGADNHQDIQIEMLAHQKRQLGVSRSEPKSNSRRHSR